MSKSSAMGVPPESVLCATQTMPHKGQYELTWDPNPQSTKTKNDNGTRVWAIVKRSTNAVYGPGTKLKVHMCAHNPCQAVSSDSKYGSYGPPVHMQGITCIGPTAAPLLPVTAAPVAEPVIVAEQSSTTIAVYAGTPTASAAPLDNAAQTRAAMDRVHNAGLALAREICKPKAWIGYIAFVLFALLKNCRPQAWEGSNRLCFIEQFAPWAKDICTKECSYAAIPCARARNTSGGIECVQISEENPLSRMTHYVAGIDIPSAPMTAVAAEATLDGGAFDEFYKTLGVYYLKTVADGDCGLDVMCLIMGVERTLQERTALREELSDYLISRLNQPWMIDILIVTQELDPDDVKLARSEGIVYDDCGVFEHELMPEAFETAVAAIVRDDGCELEHVSEEAMDAVRWASKLNDDCGVLDLVRALPKQIVQEQIRLWNASKTAVAVSSRPKCKLVVGSHPTLAHRHAVAKRFQHFCETLGLQTEDRLPRGVMIRFMGENIILAHARRNVKDQEEKSVGKKRNLKNKLNVRKWHKDWHMMKHHGETAVAEARGALSLMKSRAPRPGCLRKRAPGGGRRHKATIVREELYEWYSSIRYAIDWKRVINVNRSRGLKQKSARLPRSIIKVKVQRLLREHAQASILNGAPVQTFKPDSWWFQRWQEDYGLSLRQANRKFAVPRSVLKERLELFWVSLFRLRQLAVLVFWLRSNADEF